MAGRTRGSRDLTVGLLWHTVSSGNLGVGALTVGNLAIARRAAVAAGVNLRFLVLGFAERGVPTYIRDPDVESLPLDTSAMLPGGAYWRALKGLDCILDIGAGDSFADIYGGKRFAFLWVSKFLAELSRTPLILSPQTIGPFTRQPQTALAAHVMKRADLIVVRDTASFEVARKMAPRTRVLQAVDVAFALPYERRTKADPTSIDVGLNVSALLFNYGYSGANEFGMQVDYREYTRKLITALLERPGVTVHMVSHVNAQGDPVEDDGQAADMLVAEFPGLVRAPSFETPSAAKSYISGLDFFIGGRMHACIAAFATGVPVVPVAYSRKFAGLFEGLLGFRHVVPVAGLDTAAALAFTLDRFDRRAELAAEIAQAKDKVATLLQNYEDELAQTFARLARGDS
jgi:colanic acid/amylovoran biosynthesis protein